MTPVPHAEMPDKNIVLIPLGDLRQESMRWRATVRRWSLLVVIILMLVLNIFSSRLLAQTQPFSSSAEYKSMLDELHLDNVHPSRLSSGTLLTTVQPLVPINVDETAAALSLQSDAWRLVITKDHCGIALTNKQTGLTWQLADSALGSAGIFWTQGVDKPATLHLTKIQHIERHGNSWRMQAEVSGSTAFASLEIAVISPTVIRLSIHSPQLMDDARMGLNFSGAGPFFGLGERFDRIKLDGLKTTLLPEDLLGKPGHNWTYIPVPFLFTPRGLGMYLDTAAESNFDLGHVQQQKFSIQLKHSSSDVYFFVGEPKSILRDYTSLTGRSPIPPPWTFGVWICSYQGPQKVIEDARRLRRNGIPASAIWTYDVMDKGDIMGWPLWWTGYYAHPRQFTDQLHDMGFKVLTYVHPYLRSVLDPYNLPNPSFEEGVRKGLFVLDSQNKPTGPKFEPYLDGNIDFTNPMSVDWWEGKVREILVADNFDGWMEDFGEWVNETDHFASGATGRKMANLNPLFYHKITYEISRKAKPDAVEFVRSGYAGSQGYTRVVWGGDQLPDWSKDHGLPSVVNGGITAGLSGFSIWGPDIAGNGNSKELWTRWVEFGALTPVMRNHLWDKPEGAMNLWHDQEAMDTFRRYAKLHVSLFPYFYTYAHEAAKTGLPIIRHPLLEFPNDPKTYDANGEYLLGDKILVAPVLEQGASSRSLYIPQGFWIDYWTGKLIKGDRQVTVPAPLGKIPILVRAGSILPFIDPDTETLAQDLAGSKYRTLTNDLIWRIFPALVPHKDSFTLYDGTVAETNEQPMRITVRVEHSPTVRHYDVMLPVTRSPHRVTLAGKALGEINHLNRLTEKTGWQMSSDSRTMHVVFQADDFDLIVER
ncbi:MAG TPA: TIM-barrel domain-containing protein [Edaphobacter sp.]|nr:TIM-barrel domain-containing protein [Edaphobacter sp.]